MGNYPSVTSWRHLPPNCQAEFSDSAASGQSRGKFGTIAGCEFDDFCQFLQAQGQYTRWQITTIIQAYNFADNKFGRHLHKSGTTLLAHSVAIARLLAEIHVDTDSIVVGLLHDIIKHGATTYEEIAKVFGEKTAELVGNVQQIRALKLNGLQSDKKDLQWLFQTMAKDIRVAVIRLIHRLYDLEHNSWLSEPEQYALARETMEIYVPLTDRLGIGVIKSRLEDLAFHKLEPDFYTELKTQVEKIQQADDITLAHVVDKLNHLFLENQLSATVTSRLKSLYGIYRKIREKNLSLTQVMDKIGARVIVANVPTCYQVLGLIHTNFTPIPGTFDDYIGLPKPNNYQSLHTCIYPVTGLTTKPVEIQIRTLAMHDEAEFGAAAHWKYKAQPFLAITSREQLQWIRSLIQLRDELGDYNEFVKVLKQTVFDKNIVVFNEMGKVFYLPRNSKAIDFAKLKNISIHEHSLAKINGRLSDLDRTLNDGDTVEICQLPQIHPGPEQ